MSKNVAQLILEALSHWGVQDIFGVSGNAILPLLDAMGNQNTIKFYSTASEQGAVFAAVGAARATGTPAVCLATEGPGAVNLANGVADAYKDNVPLLVLTGQVETSKIATNAKQYIDLQQFFAPITGLTVQLTRPESVPTTLQVAMEKAVGDQVPCHVSIPKDILQAPIPHHITINALNKPNPPSMMGNMELFSSMLNNCQKPIIITGKTALPYRQKVLTLAQKIGAGIIPGQGARGIYPGSLGQNLGGLGEAHIPPLLNQADCIFLIGASSYEHQFIPHNAKTALLQIATKPQQLMTSPGLWSLTGDINTILDTLNQTITTKNNTGWREQIQQCHFNYLHMIQSEKTIMDTPISPRAVVALLNEKITPDAIITLDTGEFMHWFDRGFMAQKQDVLLSENWRSVGGGLAMAIGAKAAYPNRQVVALVGDGGLLMSGLEICTAVKYNLPVTVLVFNNGSYLLEKHRMEQHNMNLVGVDLAKPDFVGLAQACGAAGIKVTQPQQLAAALKDALTSNNTTVIDIIVNQEKPMFL